MSALMGLKPGPPRVAYYTAETTNGRLFDMNDFAPMLVMMTLIITTGGVILLRPITKKLGTYLEVLAEERRQALQKASPRESVDSARMLSLLESMDDRMQRLEDRQDFTDRLLTKRDQTVITSGTNG